MLNFNFWFAFKKVIILPSLKSLTNLSIPRNFKFIEVKLKISVSASRGSEAMRSTPNRPFKIYLRAILFPTLDFIVSFRISVDRPEVDENVDGEGHVDDPVKDF